MVVYCLCYVWCGCDIVLCVCVCSKSFCGRVKKNKGKRIGQWNLKTTRTNRTVTTLWTILFSHSLRIVLQDFFSFFQCTHKIDK